MNKPYGHMPSDRDTARHSLKELLRKLGLKSACDNSLEEALLNISLDYGRLDKIIVSKDTFDKISKIFKK